MISNTQLFSVGNFEFRVQHLLIIGILAVSFSISAMVRSQAADYGFELNEFDPYYNYRATQFLVENGFAAYYDWHDEMAWFPYGRDISATSQSMQHFTAATLYWIFGGDSSVYHFTILIPVIFGSMTAIVIFALVRVLAGTTAGLFSALFFTISVPVLVRGTIGWFKSEPLGLFYGLLGIYLFLSGINSADRKIACIKLVGGSTFLAFGLGSWGGVQYFAIPLGLFFLALPFIRDDHKFIVWAIPVFVVSLLLVTLVFERPGTSFVLGLGGVSLIGPMLILIAITFIQKISEEKNRLRNGFVLMGGTIIAGIFILVVNASARFIDLPSFRYLNAINPFLSTVVPLQESIAEHATTTAAQSFYFHSILMIFAGMGIWIIFRNKEKLQEISSKLKVDMMVFALIIGLVGVYVSSAFVRLEIFASISVIILGSIGVSILINEILRFRKQETKKKIINQPKTITKISFCAIIIILLIMPAILPVNGNWINGIKSPPTILNGGTSYNMATNDWPHALQWIKENTAENAVIAAWWDYGYWITTLGERASLADNGTINATQIKKIAEIFMSSPDSGWQKLQNMYADYVLVYVAAQNIGSANDPENTSLYLLTGGADESKKQWFIRIAEEPVAKYLHQDGFSGTDFFWENTLLGKMFPFSPITYMNLNNNQQSQTWQPGHVGIYIKDIKYPSDGNGPLRLVYTSPSFEQPYGGVVSGVIIYEINKDYLQPNKHTTNSELNLQENQEVAIISTEHGEIKIKFKEDVAPNTVENFKKLAKSGFYNGTIFHRIIPGFVIQGGDPNTISGPRDSWGMGGPGYSIEPEFSDLKHQKYIVSMARSHAIDSAGSQFYIMLGDAPHLDGQYTIFGEVISGHEIVDKIALLETNELDQPIDSSEAKMEKIIITNP